ncbi:MAG: toprim domain-containing protein [Candidatus Moraniibacteriota bacterium]
MYRRYSVRFPGEPDEDKSKYKLPPGFRKGLEIFNLHRAIDEPAEVPLVIVEGFFDCMRLHQLGCRKVVALMGSALTAAQEELLRQHVTGTSQVIVILDENEAGRTGATTSLFACRSGALSKYTSSTSQIRSPSR